MGRPSEDIYGDLLDLTQHWNASDDVPLTDQRKAVALGEELHHRGGFRLMQDCYYGARSENKYASILNVYWDGIGHWRM